MLIVCPSCASTYSLTEEQLGRGRTLRCAQCRHTWFAAPPAPAMSEAGNAPSLALAGAGAAGAVAADAVAGRRARGPGVAEGLRRAGRTAWRRASGLGLAGILATLMAAILLAALARREAVVRAMPQTARLFAAVGLPVNLRGIDFSSVRSGLVVDHEQTALVVEGEIRNVTKAPVQVASLALDLRGEAGNVLYSWTVEPPRPVLQPGESAPFRSRLVSPPAEARDVMIRFAGAGAHMAEPH